MWGWRDGCSGAGVGGSEVRVGIQVGGLGGTVELIGMVRVVGVGVEVGGNGLSIKVVVGVGRDGRVGVVLVECRYGIVEVMLGFEVGPHLVENVVWNTRVRSMMGLQWRIT